MNTTKVYFTQKILFGTKSSNIFASRRKLSIMGTDQFYNLLHNASTLPTHYVTKNQNVPIVTLVQNEVSLYNAKCNKVIKSEN